MNAHARVEQLLRRTIGLDPATVGVTRIELAVRRRMAACRLTDLEAYTVRLARDRNELQELVEAVVVPETFFFRERAALSALADMVRVGSVRGTPDQPLQVLSLPCSSGEEPYSIAMTLLAAGCASGAVRIHGVDVSREAVSRARGATYRKSSFRGGAAEYDEYFVETANAIVVRGDVRSCVRIEVGNVLAPDFSPPSDSYHVIFCRNLLIYLEAAAQRRVLALVARYLRPGGVLFVSPADAFAARTGGFAPIAIDAACAFRLRDADPRRPAWSRTPNRARVINDLTPRANRALTPGRVATQRAAVVIANSGGAAASSTATASGIASVASLANAGRLQDAIALAESVLETAGASAELFTLVGTLYGTVGNVEQAEACYRRALYLEPSYTDALLHLSLLFERHGDLAAAARLLARAQRVAPGGSR